MSRLIAPSDVALGTCEFCGHLVRVVEDVPGGVTLLDPGYLGRVNARGAIGAAATQRLGFASFPILDAPHDCPAARPAIVLVPEPEEVA